ncbi:uncharacterized protein METZ01_LOCUS482658, partial [marine metagenome]
QAEVAMEGIGDGPVPEIAVVNYRKVNELDASHLDAMWYLGLAASQQGRIVEARKFWRRLLERLPSNSEDARDIKTRIDALDEGG